MKRCGLRCDVRAGFSQSERPEEIWDNGEEDLASWQTGEWLLDSQRSLFLSPIFPFLEIILLLPSCFSRLPLPFCPRAHTFMLLSDSFWMVSFRYITIFVRVFSTSTPLSASCWETRWRGVPVRQTFIFTYYMSSVCVCGESQKCLSLSYWDAASALKRKKDLEVSFLSGKRSLCNIFIAGLCWSVQSS